MRAATRARPLPDVIEQLKILRLTAPIPNDTISFGPDFPEDLRAQVIEAMIDFSETEEWRGVHRQSRISTAGSGGRDSMTRPTTSIRLADCHGWPD
jgi:ABC-type phosphate/phosphonate transport system substrate-binding protein